MTRAVPYHLRTGSHQPCIPKVQYADYKTELSPSKPNYFMFGSNWLWLIKNFEKNVEPKNTTQAIHDEFALEYVKKQKELKHLIKKVLEAYPDSKFITDAPAWRMTGEHVMFRNYASDLHDMHMEPFWNEDGMQHHAFYSAGKKNSFSKEFNMTSRNQPVYSKGTQELFEFDMDIAKPDSLPGGLHYRLEVKKIKLYSTIIVFFRLHIDYIAFFYLRPLFFDRRLP